MRLGTELFAKEYCLWTVFVSFLVVKVSEAALERFDSSGPLNYPSWFIVPQRLAGYPLYLPQEPIFAAGGSSDFVNGWGDYRFNNFYDQTGADEPDKDPVYDHFTDILAGRYTVPAPNPNATTTTVPTTAAADAGDVDAAATDAPAADADAADAEAAPAEAAPAAAEAAPAAAEVAAAPVETAAASAAASPTLKPLADSAAGSAAVTPAPFAPAPAVPALAEAAAGSSAPTAAPAVDRPARQFVGKKLNSTRKRRRSRTGITTTTPGPVRSWNIPSLLNELAAQLTSMSKRKHEGPASATQNSFASLSSVLIPALSKLSQAEESPMFTEKSNKDPGVFAMSPAAVPVDIAASRADRNSRRNSAKKDDSFVTSSTAATTKSTTNQFAFMVQRETTPAPEKLATAPSLSEPVPAKAPFISVVPENVTLQNRSQQISTKAVDDLFQLAFAWPPLSMKRTMIALPGPVSPRPLEILQHVTRSSTFPPGSTDRKYERTFGSNATTPMLEGLFQQILGKAGGNGTYDIRYATNASDGSLLHSQKILLPAYLADFAMVPLAARRRKLLDVPEETPQFNLNETASAMDNAVLKALGNQSWDIVPDVFATKDKPTEIPVTTVFSTERTTVKPTENTMNAVLKQLGSCTVTLGSQSRFGMCVDNGALTSICDGMGIKRSNLCSGTMSCCFAIS